jgi:integrase
MLHAMMLHRILEHAVKWQLLSRNPADAVTPPITRHVEMRTLDETGINNMLAEAEKTPYFALFSLALHTGMRRSELLALRWQDIDLIMAEIYVSRSMHRLLTHEIVFRGTKTAKGSRTVALAPSTIIVLRQHLDKETAECVWLGVPFTNDRLVFCYWDGKPLIPSNVSQAWRRLARRMGYSKIRFHDLRHTCATLLFKAGIHPKIVQERLGHSSIAITLDTYSHVSPGLQHKAAEALDIILLNRIAKE